ncbi:MAG: hypothetical protein AUH39_02420 [Chloroflexi bacterium 13_1_40CM_67_9]|nr:MAG: hypothetical protein AUH39_02420 [Chloroflexi bacterium 13_1_40CM_67_9]
MTLRGSTSDFPLESVIGLLAGTSKTGELQVRGDAKVGALGFASGRLVAAVMDGEGGENALGAIFAISQADFVFTAWESAPEANLEGGDLVTLLKRAAEARDRISAIRTSIPDDRMRFRLSEKAADQGAVTFTPDRWRALLAVNGDRDVTAIAEQLRLGKMQTLTLLAGLVKDGVIEAVAAPEKAPAEPPHAYSAPPSSAPPEPEPIALPQAWSPPQTAEKAATEHDWPRSAPLAREAFEPAKEAPSQVRPASAPDWTPPELPAVKESAAPAPQVREDLRAEIEQRMGGFGLAAESPPAVEVPPAVDDRLSSLSGLFAPGPAANAPPTPAPEAPKQEVQPTDWWRAPGGGRPATSWTTPPPASTETPANAWAPTAKPKEAPRTTDPWGGPLAPQQETPASRTDEWAPPPPQPADRDAGAEKKKSGGFLSRFRREETPTPIAHIEPVSPAASKTGKLASLSNALLMEYNSGGYGKGKIETRLSNLLMRVDEQADPIDRPLPVVDDLIDAAALEREGFDEHQAVPYLATLVRQIYEDAERAFGKDRAKKGYKAAQQQVFGGDPNALQSPELAGKLPKV